MKAAKPPKIRKEPPALLPAGTVLLRLDIPQRAVPWSAPMIGKGRPVKNTRLIAWQQAVRLFASTGRVVREPYEGPVEVRVVARFAKGPLPDATNCLKALEDALQGVVFANDRQVFRNSCERTASGRDNVRIEVLAADMPDYGENG